ncbi:MAG: GAF domain-containing protein [Sandaracinaceae bacterium]|nr:GAF domain-containing protein [Sandaracinaceae bacterium]
MATESRLTVEGELARRITIEDSLGLVRVLGRVAAARDANEVCKGLVEHGLLGRPLELCALARHAPERGALETMGQGGLARAGVVHPLLPLDRATPMTDALRRDTLVEVCDDVALRARYPSCDQHGDRSLVAVPLRADDRIIGVLGVRWARSAELSNGERAMLLLLAMRIGPALERCASLERERCAREEREASVRRFHAMARISRELAEAGFDELELLERAARGIGRCSATRASSASPARRTRWCSIPTTRSRATRSSASSRRRAVARAAC